MTFNPNDFSNEQPQNDAPPSHPTENGNESLVLTERFARQAAAAPDKIAVIDQNEQLTYGQLNQQANQLAHCLQQHGVKPGQLIGISIAPSAAMVVAVFGILKAGGAFVPLDPGYPADRLAWMIEDGQIGLIVTAAARQIGGQKAKLVFLDALPADAPTDTPPVTPDPNQLACCLYTSHRILIKDGRVLDRLKAVDAVVFDKTGTLTLEQPHISISLIYQTSIK